MNDHLLSIGTSGATHRLVLLHGWGADADDLIPIGRALASNLNNDVSLEIVSLRAPHQHPEGFGRQWYGLFPSDWSAVPDAIRALKTRIEDLSTTAIPLRKTILLGFSQGGAMALAVGCELPLAGLIACSGYPHPGWIAPENRPPVLLTHGSKDEIVPCSASQKLLHAFSSSPVESELFIFEGGHEIPKETLPDLQLVVSKWCT